MKKRICLIAIAVLLALMPAMAAGEFPASSAVYDGEFAQLALSIAELGPGTRQAALMGSMGYRLLGDYNVERPAGDARHVAAYSIYTRRLDDGRVAAVIAVRGTGAGEWPLNLDLMPSGDYELGYAENFALAARNILETHADALDALDDPVLLITGYSRGAAVANVLAALLTDRFGAANVHGYTFATPRTVRGAHADYDNIFNIVNPCDLIPRLPLAEWGFERYGVDIVLPVDAAGGFDRLRVRQMYYARCDRRGDYWMPEDGAAPVEALTRAMADAMPTVARAYTERHAAAHAGLCADGEPGLTGAQMLLYLLDGELDGPDADAARLALGAQNDFSAFIGPMASGELGLERMHMPAIYGAWMTAIK